MKQTMNQILCLVAFLAVGSIPVFGKPFAEGPYLGQTPPGPIAQVFAPGLICNTGQGQWESHGTFSADGKAFSIRVHSLRNSLTAPSELTTQLTNICVTTCITPTECKKRECFSPGYTLYALEF